MGMVDFAQQVSLGPLSRAGLCKAGELVTDGEGACVPDCLEGQYGHREEARPAARDLLTDILADLASHCAILSEVAQAGGVDARNDDDAR